MWPFSTSHSPHQCQNQDGAEPGSLAADLEDASLPESLKRHLRGFGVPLNPKIRELVGALHRKGVMTTCSGDLYGDRLVYVDLENLPTSSLGRISRAIQPLGWQVAPSNKADDAYRAAAPGYRFEPAASDYANAQQRMLGPDKAVVVSRVTRIVRPGAQSVRRDEAERLALLIHGAIGEPARNNYRASPSAQAKPRPVLGADWPPIRHRSLVRTVRVGPA